MTRRQWTPEARQQLTIDLLALLPGPNTAPVSTTRLGEALDLDPYERSVTLWGELDKLAKAGFAERTNPGTQGTRLWRLTDAGLQHRGDSAA